MNNKKKWWLSKTVWVNVIVLIGMVITRTTGVELSAEESVAILAVINLILRAVTKQELSW